MSITINPNIIKTSFSKPRFQTYLDMTHGNQELAIKLYIHNAELSAALFFPINITEVTLRNAVDKAFTNQFGKNWNVKKNFRRKINRKANQKLKSIINALKDDNLYNRDQVIANLSLGFWVSTFDKKRLKSFWQKEINATFPNWKENFPNKKAHQMRNEIRKIAEPIREIRNRIAHHEPILNRNVKDTHQNMILLTTLICKETAQWMEQNSKVNEVLDNDPRNKNKP